MGERNRQKEEVGASSTSFTEILKSYVECFRGMNFRRTLGAALPCCTQQLSGLSFLNVYGSLFFKQSGFSNSFLITTILCKCIVIYDLYFESTDFLIRLHPTLCCVLSSLGSDKIGRRRLVLISVAFCMGTLLIVGILGLVPSSPELKNFLIFVACVSSYFNSIGGEHILAISYHTE